MKKHNQSGAINALVISLILAVLLLVGALAFAGWAYSSRQDYKDNVDSKVNAAVGVAKQQQTASDQTTYNEQAKQPLVIYNGPERFGSLQIQFPKTWSAYVNDSGTTSTPVDGYFAPGVVPAINSGSSVFSLRVQVIQEAYADAVHSFSGQQHKGKLSSVAYALPKLPTVVGVKINGQLSDSSPVITMVVLPLRSYTLEISTQGNQYLNDFNNYILPNFSFSP